MIMEVDRMVTKVDLLQPFYWSQILQCMHP